MYKLSREEIELSDAESLKRSLSFQRTLFVGKESICNSFINIKLPEAIVSWPLVKNADWTELFIVWLNGIVIYNKEIKDIVIEFVVENDIHMCCIDTDAAYFDKFVADSTTLYNFDFAKDFKKEIYKYINKKRHTIYDHVQYLLARAGELTIEFEFEPLNNVGYTAIKEIPIICTCILDFLTMPGFARLFSRFHKNQLVRNNGEISAKAFNADEKEWESPLSFLSPLAIVKGGYNV